MDHGDSMCLTQRLGTLNFVLHVLLEPAGASHPLKTPINGSQRPLCRLYQGFSGLSSTALHTQGATVPVTTSTSL